MRSELLTALQAINEGMMLLRAKELKDGKVRSADWGIIRGQVESNEATRKPSRFSKSKTHKASSAEAMLRHVLRQRGWTKLYGEDRLTGKQHINLLDDVRQYGRMHMRHEAETLFDQYGVEIDGDLNRSLLGDRDSRGIHDRTHSRDPLASTVAGALGQGITRGIAARASGAISRFFGRAKLFIRELIVAGAMALKGNEPLTNAELYALDRQTRKQYEYLDKFEREVVSNPPREIADLSSVIIVAGPPPMTPGQFIARAESYGNSVWEVQNVGREVARRSEVFSAERRVHAKPPGHHECRTCIEQSARGWQPVGTLLEIGDSECMGNCDCYFLWQDPKGKTFVSPWGRHNPKGYEQPAIPSLPGTSGPSEKPPRKIKLKPRPPKPEPKDLEGIYPTEGPQKRLPRPLPTVEQLLKEANSPYSADEYEGA